VSIPTRTQVEQAGQADIGEVLADLDQARREATERGEPVYAISRLIALAEDRELELADAEREEAGPATTVTWGGVTRAQADEMMQRKSDLPATPRPVKSFERGRWITRERERRRSRRPRGRGPGATPARGTTRARRCRPPSRRRSGTTRAGDPPPGDTGDGEHELDRRIEEAEREAAALADEVAWLDAEVRRAYDRLREKLNGGGDG
jgi:hypothetical protein